MLGKYNKCYIPQNVFCSLHYTITQNVQVYNKYKALDQFHLKLNRELTNKNKHVFKRTHVCLCVYLCVLSKSLLKSVFFFQFGLVDIWFGLGWNKIVETVRLFCLQPQPNQMLMWQKNTLLNTLIETAHK